MVRFVCLRAAGSTVGGNCSRCTGRERVGVEVCVVCPERTWIHSTRLHDMTARVVLRRQGAMIARAHVKRHTNTQHSTTCCGCTSLRTRRTSETPPQQEQGGETRTRSYHFRAVFLVWMPLASRLCNGPAKHMGNQWRASIGYRRSTTR